VHGADREGTGADALDPVPAAIVPPSAIRRPSALMIAAMFGSDRPKSASSGTRNVCHSPMLYAHEGHCSSPGTPWTAQPIRPIWPVMILK